MSRTRRNSFRLHRFSFFLFLSFFLKDRCVKTIFFLRKEMKKSSRLLVVLRGHAVC